MILFISTIIFDLKGNDFGDLKQKLGKHWLHMSVHSGMRVGMNNPDGTPPGIWINLISYLFSARAGIVSARVTLASIIRWLVATLNPKPLGRLLWPDWQLVLDVARKAPARLFAAKEDYLRSLLQVLDDVTMSSGDLLRTFDGLDLEAHVIAQRRCLIIDFSNLYPPWLRLFLVDLLVSQLLVGRMARKHRVGSTEVLIIIDEGDALVARQCEAAFPDGMSPLATLFKQGREFGLACCLGLTFMGNASRYVLNAAQYHLLFSLADDESVLEAKRTLQLPPGAEQQFPALQPGEALFREAQASWPHTVWVKTDYVPPCR